MLKAAKLFPALILRAGAVSQKREAETPTFIPRHPVGRTAIMEGLTGAPQIRFWCSGIAK